jgi:hypothetical protein
MRYVAWSEIIWHRLRSNSFFLWMFLVKCTLVQALKLCKGRTVRRGRRVITLPFLDHSTRRGWGVSVMPLHLFTPRKYPVSIVQEAGWASGSVWTSAENLAPTGIQSPDLPARSQSLFRLSYPVHGCFKYLLCFVKDWICFARSKVFIVVLKTIQTFCNVSTCYTGK